MADCPHALPVLVEHLVRTSALRQPNHRVFEGRQASPAHPACAGTNWRTHGPPRCGCDSLVSGTNPFGRAPGRGSAQHRCVGHGPGHLKRRLPRNPFEDAPRLLERVSWRSEEHTSELQSHLNLVCRLLLEKKKILVTTADTPLNSHAFYPTV